MLNKHSLTDQSLSSILLVFHRTQAKAASEDGFENLLLTPCSSHSFDNGIVQISTFGDEELWGQSLTEGPSDDVAVTSLIRGPYFSFFVHGVQL